MSKITVTDENGKEYEVMENCLMEKEKYPCYKQDENGDVVYFKKPGFGVVVSDRLEYVCVGSDGHFPESGSKRVTPEWKEV